MVQPYQGNFVKRHTHEFVKAIDDFLKMDKKLITHFNPASLFYMLIGEDEVITFESFY